MVMQVGSASILDPLECAAEGLRRELGVDTLSVSCLRSRAGDLRTLVNVGALGPGEHRRPPAECYPLHAFPAADALVRHRRPYLSTRGAVADPASVALEARLEKTSQAAAPLVIGDEVWGELWVASTTAGLPLSRAELPLICWAAERFGPVVAELLGDDSALASAATDAVTPDAPPRYEIWIEGHLSAFVEALIAAAARRHQQYTVFEAALDRADLYRLLSRVDELALPVVAVRRAQPPAPPPERIPGRGRLEHVYQLRIGGHVDAERLRAYVDCTVEHHAGQAVVTARLDPAGFGGLLRVLERIGADLLGVRRTR
jgi:hypothetical protein